MGSPIKSRLSTVTFSSSKQAIWAIIPRCWKPLLSGLLSRRVRTRRLTVAPVRTGPKCWQWTVAKRSRSQRICAKSILHFPIRRRRLACCANTAPKYWALKAKSAPYKSRTTTTSKDRAHPPPAQMSRIAHCVIRSARACADLRRRMITTIMMITGITITTATIMRTRSIRTPITHMAPKAHANQSGPNASLCHKYSRRRLQHRHQAESSRSCAHMKKTQVRSTRPVLQLCAQRRGWTGFRRICIR